MMKSLVVFGVIAAACSSSFAAEVKKDKAPVVKAATMSDAQMDKVTAGNAGGVPNLGGGQGNGFGYGGGMGTPGGGNGLGASKGNGRF
jgi:hypothetical protein